MDGEPVALAGFDAIHVLAGTNDASAARDVAAGDHFEQRRLARAVGTEHADDLGPLEREVCGERERDLAAQHATAIALVHLVEHEQRGNRMRRARGHDSLS